MAPQSSFTDLTRKDELILKNVHATKKAPDSKTVHFQERCDWTRMDRHQRIYFLESLNVDGLKNRY
jgi:hypothetical protein